MKLCIMLKKFIMILMLCVLYFASFAQKFVDVKITLPADNFCIEAFSPIITIFPNPNNGNFIIDIANCGKNQISGLTISNSLGLIVYSKKIEYLTVSQIPIILSNVSKGLYYVTFIEKHGIIPKKLIIQ